MHRDVLDEPALVAQLSGFVRSMQVALRRRRLDRKDCDSTSSFSGSASGGIAREPERHAAAQPSRLGAADSRSTARSAARTALTARTAWQAALFSNPALPLHNREQRASTGTEVLAG